MKADFWLERWQDNRIGFHQSEYNSRLTKHWADLRHESPNFLVPLCGKTLDLRYLAQFGSVTGVELSGIAVDAFFSEWSLKPVRGYVEGMPYAEGGGVRLIQGDIFELPSTLNGLFTHIFDRAAMIALPDPMRKSYVKTLSKLLASDGEILAVTIQYPDGQLPGPPFSVSPAWLIEHGEAYFDIEHVEAIDTWEPTGPLAQEGLTALETHVFKLRHRR